MPRMDGTGPMGAGFITGRGFGICIGADAVKYEIGREMGFGRGLACRRGFGRGFGRDFPIDETSSKTQKELLQTMLQNQLEAIDKQLEQQ